MDQPDDAFVVLALSREGLDAFRARRGTPRRLWVGAGLLRFDEMQALRADGVDLVDLASRLAPDDLPAITRAVDTIRDAHPGLPVWVEFPPATPSAPATAPTMTVPEARALHADERALLRWLLEHADAASSAYLAQLAHARVATRCACGCASIGLAVGADPVPGADEGVRVLADAEWTSPEGHLHGAYVFARAGRLAGLELWSIDGRGLPDALPPLEALVPLGTPAR